MDAMRFVRLPRVGWMLPMLGLFLGASAAAAPPDLFAEYGDGDRHFERLEIGSMLVYFHQRMIGQATVEKDYIVYQLDKDTGELLARKSHWRNDLPAVLPTARVSREQAEAMVEGEIRFSGLYLISPESDVFPLNPTPENPCWAVRSIGEHGEYVVTLIDAVSGVILGQGVPPPYTAFSMTGPQRENPCGGAWSSWSQNAEAWFNTLGYSTEVVEWPTKARIQSHIQSTDTAMFYEIAHSGGVSTQFTSGCVGGYYEFTYATDIEAWMVGYEKMPFTFLASCFAMCSTGAGNLAYEFRKGSDEDATVVGYCGMSEPQCANCWPYSIDWQDALFHYMSLGHAVKDAYDRANADYPVCVSGDCMRFAGDEDFAVVPPVPRSIPGLKFDYPNGLPELVDPDGGEKIRVEVSALTLQPKPDTGMFHYKVAGGNWVSEAMQVVSPNVYDAVLPAVTCGKNLSYYFSAETTTGETVRDPQGAPGSAYSALSALEIVELYHFNFETSPGWSAENLGATNGDWERGVPVNDPGWQYDPISDSDGSGQCWLTENRLGNTDVDNGAVRLMSSEFDLSMGHVTIAYDYYLYLTNTTGGVDRLLVEISSNGTAGPWIEIARHTSNGGLGWRTHSIDQDHLNAAGVTMTTTMRLRWTTNDADPQSINESGLDALFITAARCEPQFKLGDMNCDGSVNFDDIDPFVLALSGQAAYQAQYPNCRWLNADINQDGKVDFDDIDPFVALLGGG